MQLESISCFVLEGFFFFFFSGGCILGCIAHQYDLDRPSQSHHSVINIAPQNITVSKIKLWSEIANSVNNREN